MTATPTPVPHSYASMDSLVDDYVSRGIVVIDPEDLGVPLSIHKRVFEQEVEAFRAKRRIDVGVIPEMLDIINSPGVVDACNLLVGNNWAIVPFTHNTPFLSGAHDQHWHKDDNGPYNMRKVRHHHAVQLEMLYYPQSVADDMGPTATVPYSQYWTFNHEENHDNFAGADHLDFAYQLNGMERLPVSGPRSNYDEEDIVKRSTPHDIRMRDAVSNLEWPHCQPYEVAPLKAGSVVLYSHNLLHRGNHRRDDWRTWKDNPRFLWRFWLYRTTEPKTTSVPVSKHWDTFDKDHITGIDLSEISSDVRAVWDYHRAWLHGRRLVATIEKENDIGHLTDQLYSTGDVAEPDRIGAAYRLGNMNPCEPALTILERALNFERESVRRAATFGLIAYGVQATPILLNATYSAAKWVRKAAVFALGESGSLNIEVAKQLKSVLLHDESTYVRSVAASAIGCFARRSIAAKDTTLMPTCASAIVESLDIEVNHLSMDRSQNRSIKFVRPTDESDVCEGIGFDYGHARFKPVRSAVRENALWSAVIIASHPIDFLGAARDTFIASLVNVVQEDDNLFSVGLAMDALYRLANLNDSPESSELASKLEAIFDSSPIRCDDSLSRSRRLRYDPLSHQYKQANSAASLPTYDSTPLEASH